MDANTTIFLVLINLFLGLSAGIIMYRSDFCIAGMFRDLFLFKDSFMLRQLFLLIILSMILIELARIFGLLSVFPFPWYGEPSAAGFVGGLFFGMGMVLAGGCVVGTLYKMGGGNVLSAVAFSGLILGNLLYVAIHPWWAKFIQKTTLMHGSITLPQLLGVAPSFLVAIVGGATGFGFVKWFKNGQMIRAGYAAKYLQPWKAAVGLAFIGLLSCVFVGLPLAITTSYAKLSAYIGSLCNKSYIENLAYFQIVSLSYNHPLTGALLTGGAGPRLDAVAAIQLPLVFGIVLGAALYALFVKEFVFYFRQPPRQYASAIFGGILMAMGARMAAGCNVWYLLGGLPIMQLGSILFLVGIFPGAYLGTKILSQKVLNS